MKKIALFVFSFLTMALAGRVSAEELESPFVEGRQWIFEVFTHRDEPYKVPYMILYADGDTIIEGRACKTIMEVGSMTPDLEGSVVEKRMPPRCDDGGCVSILLDDSYWKELGYDLYPEDYPWLRFFDMNLSVGDKFHHTFVKTIDYILVHGKKRKRIITGITGYPDSEHNRWVEGIGCWWDWKSEKGFITSESPWYKFYECRQDGQVIFSYDDFCAPSYDVTGIGDTAQEDAFTLQLSHGTLCAEGHTDAPVCLTIFSGDGIEVTTIEGNGQVNVSTAIFGKGVFMACAESDGKCRTLKWMQ